MKRNTQQRQVILRLLSARKDHPTAEELYQEVRQEMPRVSMGTVYRNLDLLARKGEIRRIDGAAGPSRFDPVNDNHPHYRCPGCNRVFDLPRDLSLERLVDVPLLKKHGFTTDGLVLEVRKYCDVCRAAVS
ncbi:MAG: transcriptional repressor [Spirochaetales bacterium]|nr:transcriptional repressor [Spirochaetales bacterium]